MLKKKVFFKKKKKISFFRWYFKKKSNGLLVKFSKFNIHNGNEFIIYFFIID